MIYVYRYDYTTVFCGVSEVIVYGSGSDWIVRHSLTTNTKTGWCRWFDSRDAAEEFAENLSNEPYQGPITN